MTRKPRVLFLCTGNSCRSQMAEGWVRRLWDNRIEVHSAGIETHGLNPAAVRVMAEVGVDIAGHRSKRVDELLNIPFDLVITVCGHAHETCPVFPTGAKVIHVGFDDPPRLAESAATVEAKLDCYRRVRDEIRRFAETLPEVLTGLGLALPPGTEPLGPSSSASVEAPADHFDRAAATWDANPLRQALTAAVARAICETVPLRPRAALLEYGCGTAALSVLLAPHVGRIVAADSSAGMLAEAGRKLSAGGAPTIQLLRLDLTHEPPPAECFDLVVSSMALHHVVDTERILAALSALVRPGGWLAIADLCSEDGSFHADMAVPHHGFAPDALASALTRLGLAAATWRVVHVLPKGGREYPIFLLVARQAPAGPEMPEDITTHLGSTRV